MEEEKSTVRLVYPQWQGGDVVRLLPEVECPEDAARCYSLGAHILNLLAPADGQITLTVPVETAPAERTVSCGVLDREVIIRQMKAALRLLDEYRPARVVTLGGECSVSVVPFTYLAERYHDDVAMVWIDAHPDITLPGDVYAGFHAMAVTACMGLGDAGMMSLLPARFEASRILYVGLRNWEREEIRMRQQQYGLRHLTREEMAGGPDALREWLDACGASKAVVHFDLDVLDPAEIIAAAGTDPDGMKMADVVRVIREVAEAKELVGLTVAEAAPRTAMRLKRMLEQLPLLRSGSSETAVRTVGG